MQNINLEFKHNLTHQPIFHSEPSMTEEWFNIVKTKDIQYLQQNVEKYAGTQNEEGMTLLMQACYQLETEQIVQILSKYEQGIKNKQGKTALDICIQTRTYVYVQYLQQEYELEKDCILTNLMWACCHPNNEDAVKELAEKEQGRTADFGVTALMVASVCRNFQYIQYLEEEIGKQDQNGSTALIYACEISDNEDVVKILSQYEQKFRKNNGRTALFTLAENRKSQYTQYLTNEYDMQNKYGDTALMIACTISNNEEAVQFLAQHELGLRDELDRTALMCAVENNHPQYIQYLQQEMGLKNVIGRTAMYYACEKGYLECAKQLLTESFIEDKTKSPLLEIAKQNGHEEIVMLLQRGIITPPNAENIDHFGNFCTYLCHLSLKLRETSHHHAEECFELQKQNMQLAKQLKIERQNSNDARKQLDNEQKIRAQLELRCKLERNELEKRIEALEKQLENCKKE